MGLPGSPSDNQKVAPASAPCQTLGQAAEARYPMPIPRWESREGNGLLNARLIVHRSWDDYSVSVLAP